MGTAIYNADTGVKLGELSEEQLADLVELLEEEASGDVDRFINHETLEFLRAQGADAALIELLANAVGQGEGVEVRWDAKP